MLGMHGFKRRKEKRHETGKCGEDLAQGYLKKLGHLIVATNYRAQRGEIDIISQDGKTLVFTEVRSRSCRDILPEMTVDEKKQGFVRRTAMQYLYAHHGDDFPECRFDVVAVVFTDDGSVDIRHYPNAF